MRQSGPVVVPGDIDGNEFTDLSDAILVLKLLAGITAGNINADADINKDGKIGLEEIVYILQKISELQASG